MKALTGIIFGLSFIAAACGKDNDTPKAVERQGKNANAAEEAALEWDGMNHRISETWDFKVRS